MKAEASLEAFLELLDMPDDMAWGLFGVDEAQAMYLELSDTDLRRMQEEWRQWTVNRIDHLACVMGARASEIELALALDLSTSIHPTVASKARDAIDEIEADIRMKASEIQ